MYKKLNNNQLDIITKFYIKKYNRDKNIKIVFNSEKLKIFIRNNQLLKDNALKLAIFLENKGYPTYKKGASCGANIGEALIDFGIEGLPKSGRDGYKWSSILDKNKNFIKKLISNPNLALPGGILVYDKGFSNNVLRKEYGHVEIKTINGYWYGGKPKIKAGGNILSGFIGYVYYPKLI